MSDTPRRRFKVTLKSRNPQNALRYMKRLHDDLEGVDLEVNAEIEDKPSPGPIQKPVFDEKIETEARIAVGGSLDAKDRKHKQAEAQAASDQSNPSTVRLVVSEVKKRLVTLAGQLADLSVTFTVKMVESWVKHKGGGD